MSASFPLPAFTTVIVTRNRPDALALSLPLHLAQDCLPETVMVIDSSDDPAPNQALVARLAAQTPVPLFHVASPPGMTLQRNIGLARVSTEVVFFPDDDSLLHPGTLTAMLRIYARDTDRIIGGVCAAEAKAPPPGVLQQATYRKSQGDVLRSKISHLRSRMERAVLTSPTELYARRRYASLPVPPHWLAEEDAASVNWMTGFRMSFRTEVIRQRGFAEELGRYAICEDLDASFSVLRSHLLVGARQAQIYHHRMPGRRANGHALGAMAILNRAYVFARTGMHDRQMRAAVLQSLRYKTLLYRLGAKDSFTRERLAGARQALALAPSLLDTAESDITRHYLEARQQCIDRET